VEPEEILHNLIVLSEKLAIDIRQENFRSTRTKIKSGYCKIKGKDSYIMDKHLPVIQKVNLLGAFLASRPLEDIYVLPAVRQFLSKFSADESPQR
jgi:hypothetical protein